MAQNSLQEYSIGVSFAKATENLATFERRMGKFQDKMKGGLPFKTEDEKQQNNTEKIKNKALKLEMAAHKEDALRTAKALKTEMAAYKEDANRSKNALKTELSAHKENTKRDTKQASDVKRLQAAKDEVKQTALWRKQDLTTLEKQVKESITLRVEQAKTTKEVKQAVAQEMRRLKVLKQENYMLQRMKDSSKQFAGNMVSAFAVVAAGTGIVRVGQDFESVRNTMLAVSADAKESGNNFEFVQKEAFRLGLGLKESAKGFAKLVAARGDMSLADTKEAFKGVAEMSTLLGLSAEESTRALNALQQIGGLPYTEMCL